MSAVARIMVAAGTLTALGMVIAEDNGRRVSALGHWATWLGVALIVVGLLYQGSQWLGSRRAREGRP